LLKIDSLDYISVADSRGSAAISLRTTAITQFKVQCHSWWSGTIMMVI